MEQNLTFEIVDLLLKERVHAREAAKRLNINHMTVMRKMRSLLNDNVLDVSNEGRNKVFFVKKSLEARIFVLMTELFKLERLLTKYSELRRIVTQIQQNKNVKLAIFFGSYAKGEATRNSDVDVFIETRSEKLRKEVEKVESRLSVKIGSFDREILLIKELEKNHVIIKGAENFYEKTKYFD